MSFKSQLIASFWQDFNERNLNNLKTYKNAEMDNETICSAAIIAIEDQDEELLGSLDFPCRYIMYKLVEKPVEFKFLLQFFQNNKYFDPAKLRSKVDIPCYVWDNAAEETKVLLRKYDRNRLIE